MRTTSLLFFVLFLSSCKKEKTTEITPKKDSISNNIITKKDSVSLSIYKFSTELCLNKGHYATSKYSKEQLDGTYKIWYQLSGTLLSTESVFSLKDLEEVRINKDRILKKLNDDYSLRKEEINNLKVVDTEYWNNAKKTLLKELDAEFEFHKTEISAFSDPSILINNKLSKDCNNFAWALNTDQENMISEWKKLREKMSKNNANPERIMNEFHERLNSDRMKDYATIDLITFGWGNCVNKNLTRLIHDKKMNDEFNALFVKIDRDCDES